ncbi:MAG: bacillithiol biosynthesis cysteine-adding enzyme BshC [Brumimicrobium sp.]|nr:bacillithiol biosynthesis cysteine-adding enzyme BshC [Brumimicrobium sp.]
MNKLTINRRHTHFFSELSNQLCDNQELFKDFIQEPISLESFERQIQRKQKSYSTEQRLLTYTVLKEQLEPYFTFSNVQNNVELFKEKNTYTVTAGHQLSLYGGPLYTAYKIMDAIKLTEQLAQRYSDYNFVPIFWMASEDHDFEEINHIHLFNDKLIWESTQEGPVGRFKLHDIKGFKQNLLDKFKNNEEFASYLSTFYQKETLAESTREFLMDLFGDYGLLILDADDKRLKTSFIPIIEKELTEQFSESPILEAIQKLEKIGYHGQATPRPINLFYIDTQTRERIIPIANKQFEIGKNNISQADLLQEVKQYPERFSPNVVMRPLYQECILPNLCYLGGGGEMAYWLELKGMFEQTSIPYPLIKVRNSIQYFDKTTVKKIEQLELHVDYVFKPIDELKKQFVLDNAEDKLDFTSLDASLQTFTQELESTILHVDKGLDGFGKGEIVRIQKQIDVIKEKLIRQQKRKFDESMQKIDGIYERLFPGNGLQERFENIIPYIAKYGKKEFIHKLYEVEDPLQPDLILLIEE